MTGLSIYRTDRANNRGGGVALYLPAALMVTVLDTPPWSLLPDSLWCTFRTNRTNQCLVGVVYRSPNSNQRDDQSLLNIFEAIDCSAFSSVLVLGDFNTPHANFALLQATTGETSFAYRLLRSAIDKGLTEHVQGVTRHRVGQVSSRLDLVFTNEPHLVENLRCTAPLGLSDHVLLTFDFICDCSWVNHTPGVFRAFHRTNLTALREHMSKCSWNPGLTVSIENQWLHIKQCVINAIDISVPLRTPAPKRQKHWIRRSTRKLICMKGKAWDHFIQVGSPQARATYNKLRNKCNTAVKRDRMRFQQQLAARVKGNPKSFYSFLAGLSKAKQGVSSITVPSGRTTSDKEAADVIAQQFASVFGPCGVDTHTSRTRLSQNSCTNVTTIDIPNVTEEDVCVRLSRLNINKSMGADGIHPKILRECADLLSKPFSELFQRSLGEGKVPAEWKHADVMPLFKGGNRSTSSNYRPIALLFWMAIQSGQDSQRLQGNMDRINGWAIQNLLPLNAGKCSVLHIGPGEAGTYYINETPLRRTDNQRDLGTIIDKDLNTSLNTANMARKANSVFGLVTRNLGRILPQYFHTIFCSLIRPHLEINIQAYSPFLRRDITLLEKVQRRATKRVVGLQELSYPNRLKTLNLFSLEHRRLRGDMILTHKILHASGHPCEALLRVSSKDHLRGHPLKLEHQISKINARHYSFAVRVPRYWNTLPADVVMAENTAKFKSKFDVFHANVHFTINQRPYTVLHPSEILDPT
ncbi:hypothetical protein B566_EDAN019067 [Ephemera danica]|nr:hypothetical protein B566_EDAN019067 [Ephemera danica]